MLSLTLLPLLLAADADRTLALESSKTLAGITQVIVYRSADVTHRKPLAMASVGKSTVLLDPGPYDVFATPKGGLAIRVAHKLAITPGATHTLKLAESLGVVEVFGDNFPRADAVVLTATDDPGPGEKGHTAVQKANDYRIDMIVPEGTYAVWVVPANGARAQKVSDNVRVLAGRSVRVE